MHAHIKIMHTFVLIYLKSLPSSIAPLMVYVTYQAKFSFLYCHTCIRNQSHTASSGCEESLGSDTMSCISLLRLVPTVFYKGLYKGSTAAGPEYGGIRLGVVICDQLGC